MESEGLVYVGKIVELVPIEGADLIVAATVVCGAGGKWKGVVRKADFSLEDKCLVYLPDALIPESEEMAFMKHTNWRVKMRLFRGSPSEVVIMPYLGHFPIGMDMTAVCKVTKYQKPMAGNLASICKGNFPSFIPKTDEPNWQSNQVLVDALIGHPYYITVKYDGSSTTAYKYKDKFGVCSRNLEVIETENNAYWQVARQWDLENRLPEGIAIQWETCGPGIQKNPMGLEKIEGFVFSAYNIEEQRYLEMYQLMCLCLSLDIPRAEIIDSMFKYENIDLREAAKGTYPNGEQREGIVVRSQELIEGRLISFKSINLLYED